MLWLLVVLAALVVVPVLFLWWASGPGIGTEVGEFPVDSAGEGSSRSEPGEMPASLKILSFNVAYGRGPRDDVGDLRSGTEVHEFLSRLADFIRASGADIAALQEVDFFAHRTSFIDEAAFLARESGLAHCARITTWTNRYIPYPYWPPTQHYGHTESGQCVLSRFPLERNMRYVLPQPDANPWFYNLFYLHRSIQRVDVRVGGGRRLRVFNVHLEAFDVPNKMDQARMLTDRVAREGTPHTVVLGDFNAVPPEATLKHGFPDEPETDLRQDETIAILGGLDGYQEAVEVAAKTEPGPHSFTFPANAPNRRLDYLFFSNPGLAVRDARVAHDAGAISDHLPVLAELVWSDARQPGRHH